MPSITGPFTKTRTVYWPNSSGRKEQRDQLWFRQYAKDDAEVGDHLRPLSYKLSFCEAYTPGSDAPNLAAGYYSSQAAVPYFWSAYADSVHNRCYEKFVSKTQAAASQVGASLGERRQTIDMMAKRLVQLKKAAQALKRGRPKEFFKELGLAPRRWMPNRSDPKKAADLWLEWHFGWEPLFGDVYNACVILQSPTPALIKVRVRASEAPDPWKETNRFPDWSSFALMQGMIAEHMGARVTVTNPNAWRATQLGLVNPASIAWELVPFSFVVDWFIPVGAFLNSFTNFYGLQLDEVYTTLTRWYYSEYTIYDRNGVVTDNHEGRGFHMERGLYISGPSLSFRPLKGPSVIRAATAASVLIQVLSGLPNRWHHV